MTAATNIITVDDAFFQRLANLLVTTPHPRPCPELPDADLVWLGLYRVLEASPQWSRFPPGTWPAFPEHARLLQLLRYPAQRPLGSVAGGRP